MPIRVLMAENQALLVEGCRYALNEYDIEICCVVDNLSELSERYLEQRPDALIIDIRISAPEVGLAACELLLSLYPEAKIVVFSQIDEDQYLIEKAYRIGVMAFVLKNESPQTLSDAIHHAARGEDYFSPLTAQALARALVRGQNPTRLLNTSEMRVFQMVADGVLLADIARIKGVSLKTVSNLLRAIRDKLHIQTQSDFTKLAIRFGLTTTQLRSLKEIEGGGCAQGALEDAD